MKDLRHPEAIAAARRLTAYAHGPNPLPPFGPSSDAVLAAKGLLAAIEALKRCHELSNMAGARRYIFEALFEFGETP
jgi:hypothetical protein